MRPLACVLVVVMNVVVATPGLSAQRDASLPSFAAAVAADGKTPPEVRAANSRFAGIWQLVSEDTRDAKGQIIARGANAAAGGRFGYIVYDPAGYVSVTIAWRSQPTFTARQPTVDEARLALSTYNSYWGSFAVNADRGVVTHQTFGALSPSFSGTDQARGFTIAGNRLTLRPPTSANGDQRSLTWERVPDLPTLTPLHRRLIGFWKLISFERRNGKGELLSASPGMTGFIVYTASGHVMVHMMQPYRRRNVGEAPTPQETIATYRSYTSYFGSYTVDESAGYVVHHIAGTFNSGAVGTDFQRFVELSGNRLTLKPPVTTDDRGERVHTAITWERLSDE